MEIIDDYNRYRVGTDTYSYDPSKEVYKNMLHIVAYDVRDPSRLRRVAKICEDYGIRVEYSIFECDLDEDTFARMWSELTNEVDEEEDKLLTYRICGSCVQNIISGGVVVRPGKPLLYIL